MAKTPDFHAASAFAHSLTTSAHKESTSAKDVMTSAAHKIAAKAHKAASKAHKQAAEAVNSAKSTQLAPPSNPGREGNPAPVNDPLPYGIKGVAPSNPGHMANQVTPTFTKMAGAPKRD